SHAVCFQDLHGLWHFRAHLSAAPLKLAGKDFPEISEYSSALDHFAAGGRAFCDSIGKTGDDWMFQAFAHHLVLHGRNVVRELASEIGNAAKCFVRVELQLDRKRAPVRRPDVTKTGLTTDLHRYFRLFDVDVGVRKNAGHVIEWC